MRFLILLLLALTCAPQAYAYDCRHELGQGTASWYGPRFEGKPTASGEIFYAEFMTAAHPTLPFGTMVKVKNNQNNLSALVKINDRGNFQDTRIIDLSAGAARQIGMDSKSGLTDVIIYGCVR